MGIYPSAVGLSNAAATTARKTINRPVGLPLFGNSIALDLSQVNADTRAFLADTALTTVGGEEFTYQDLLFMVRDHNSRQHLTWDDLGKLFPTLQDRNQAQEALDRLTNKTGLIDGEMFLEDGIQYPYRLTDKGKKLLSGVPRDKTLEVRLATAAVTSKQRVLADDQAFLAGTALTTVGGDEFTYQDLLCMVRDYNSKQRLTWDDLGKLFPTLQDRNQAQEALDRLRDKTGLIDGDIFMEDDINSPYRLTDKGERLLAGVPRDKTLVRLAIAAVTSKQRVLADDQAFLAKTAVTTLSGDKFTNRDLLQMVRDHGARSQRLGYYDLQRLFPHPDDASAVDIALDQLGSHWLYGGEESPYGLEPIGLERLLEDNTDSELAHRLKGAGQRSSERVEQWLGEPGIIISRGELTNRQLLELVRDRGTDPYGHGGYTLTYSDLMDYVNGDRGDFDRMQRAYSALSHFGLVDSGHDSGNIYMENKGYRTLGMEPPESTYTPPSTLATEPSTAQKVIAFFRGLLS